MLAYVRSTGAPKVLYSIPDSSDLTQPPMFGLSYVTHSCHSTYRLQAPVDHTHEDFGILEIVCDWPLL